MAICSHLVIRGCVGLRTEVLTSRSCVSAKVARPSHKISSGGGLLRLHKHAQRAVKMLSSLKETGPDFQKRGLRPEREKYIPGYDKSILQHQAARTAEKQADFVLPFIEPGYVVLDCGCGPGSISLGLAERVGPNGKLIGVDIEEKVVVQAQRRAEELRLAAISTFQQASIYSLPFEDNFFDVTFAHAVIQHLSEPAQAVAEMVRVLKPGGLIALHAPDWGGFLYAPRTDALVAAIEYYMQLQVRKGGDPYAGRKLKALLQKANVSSINVQLSFDIDDPAAAAGFLARKIEESVNEGAITRGWSTQEKIDEMLWSLHNEFAVDPAAIWAPTRCVVLGRK